MCLLWGEEESKEHICCDVGRVNGRHSVPRLALKAMIELQRNSSEKFLKNADAVFVRFIGSSLGFI